jgi:ABC-2 type transport system ATP-binding protein
VHFARAGAPEEARLASLAGVSRVVYETDEIVLFTSNVPATIAALLELTRRAGTEPANLMVRRASLEDVFLELTGRSLRD